MAAQIPEKKPPKKAIGDELKKIKSLGFKDGIIYIWDYYKFFVLIPVFIALTIWVASTGDNMKVMAFHCSVTAEVYLDYTDYLDAFDNGAPFDPEENYAHMESVTKLGTIAGQQHTNWINTGQLDMLICDPVMTENTMKLACFFELTDFLPEDLLAEFEDKLYYYESEEYGLAGYYAVDLSSYFGYGEGSSFEDGLYAFIPSNTSYSEYAIAFLRFVVENNPQQWVAENRTEELVSFYQKRD